MQSLVAWSGTPHLRHQVYRGRGPPVGIYVTLDLGFFGVCLAGSYFSHARIQWSELPQRTHCRALRRALATGHS